jgi:hypothetical protein
MILAQTPLHIVRTVQIVQAFKLLPAVPLFDF